MKNAVSISFFSGHLYDLAPCLWALLSKSFQVIPPVRGRLIELVLRQSSVARLNEYFHELVFRVA